MARTGVHEFPDSEQNIAGSNQHPNGYDLTDGYDLSNDSEYLALLDKYKNIPDVYDRLINNPYVKYEAPQTFFGALGDSTGLWRSSLSKTIEERKALFKETNAQIINDYKDKLYNSPANSKALEQDAGLNPDITGVQPGNSQSTPIADKNESAPIGLQSSVKDAFDSLGNIVQSALSLYSGFQSISSTSNLIESQRFGLIDTADKLSQSLARSMNFHGTSYQEFLKHLPTWVNTPYLQLTKDDWKMFENFVGFPLNKSSKKTLLTRMQYNLLSEDFFNQYIKTKTESNKSVVDYGKSSAHPSLSDAKNFGIGTDAGLSSVALWFEPYLNLEAKVMKGDYDVAISQNKYNYDYWSNMNGSKMAKFDSNIKEKQSGLMDFSFNEAKFKDDLNGAWRDVISKLRVESLKGNNWASALLITMMFGGQALQSFGGFSTFTNPKTASRSFGMSFH